MPDPANPVAPPARPGHSALFISYRSADGKKDASRLAEDLRDIFGAEQVFFDKHDLQAGASWREQIDRVLHRRPVVLLVITEQFFGARDAQGLRIEQPDDPVRNEVLDAIRAHALLLPLLCEGVTMPREADLPADLRAVPQAHALKLRTEDWGTDLLKLGHRLVELGFAPIDDDWPDRYTQPGLPARRWRLRQPLVMAAITVALAGGGTLWWQHQTAQRQADAVAAQRERALQLLSAGLEAHRGKDVNLDLARIQYLAALEAQPDYGPAHYFLAQIYATQSLLDDALDHFRAALAHPAGLDKPQITDASQRLAALERSQTEPDAMGSRVAGAASPPASVAVAPMPAPLPAPMPTPPRPAPARPADGALAGGQGAGSGTGALATRPATRPVTPPATDGPDATPPRTQAAQLVERVPARPERQQEAQAQADALFAAPVATRLNAATTLGVEAGLASDVLPLALQRALAASAHSPLSDAERAGLIATLRLIGNASPLSLQAHRADIEALLQAAGRMDTTLRIQGGVITATQALAASRERRPLAYIQISNEAQRRFAGVLAGRLRQAGYDVPDIENIGNKAPARTDLRSQGFSNLGLARWMAKAVGDAGGTPVGVQVLRRAKPSVDTYEVWLGRELCVAPDQQPAACAAR